MKFHSSKKKTDTLAGRRIWANNWFVLRYIFRYAPLLITAEFALHLMVTLPKTFSEIFLLKYVMDVVASGRGYERLLWAGGLFLALWLVGEIFGSAFFDIYVERAYEKLFLRLNTQLYQKAMQMDLSAYDDPEFYNDFVYAMQSAQQRVRGLPRALKGALENIITAISVAGLILVIDWRCLALILLGGLAIIPLNKRISRLVVKMQDEMNPLERVSAYFLRVFTLPDYAKELRLNAVGGLLGKRYAENVDIRQKTSLRHNKRLWKLRYAQESLPITLLILCFTTAYMGCRAIVSKTIGAGDFVATLNGAQEITFAFLYFTGWGLRNFREDGLFIEKIRKFLDYEPKIRDGAAPRSSQEPKTIQLENVGFTYEGNAQASLKNISITVESYQKIALVGYNGAGKTTLTNLLLRLYDVSEGAIRIDGADIRGNTLEMHKAQFSAVYQDFKLFAATLGENVARGPEPDEMRVAQALAHSGFAEKLAELEKGVHTPLLREFDDAGVQLSGGEEQKVAIAGAFYQNSPYVILDEPSANLDPQSEYQLNLAMTQAAQNKTVIFISHRLSTTRMADCIYMMEEGEIVESGTHDALMAVDGKYAYMFRLQAEKYQ